MIAPLRTALVALIGLITAIVPPASAAPGAAPDCVTHAGRTACGHNCVYGNGQVRCSQTPQGTCSFSQGMAACWDPPPMLKFVMGDRVPRPGCIVASGQAACGYHCAMNYGRVQCAQTPFGACRANEGHVVCWDPPGPVIASMGTRTPNASCLAQYGKVACGYSCNAYDGEVRCAQTPQGTCSVQSGTLICWDPPLESIPSMIDPNAELACIDAGDGRACGYRCMGTPNQAKCGSRRGDVCRVGEDDAIHCAEP